MSSLYEELGGQPAVDAAVDIFYRHILADERVNHWFENIDMEKQIAKQKAFMTMAFGGPHNYTGADMRQAHRPLVARGLNDDHFNAIAENLQKALAELDVPQEKIDKVLALVETTRNDVLDRAPAETQA
jgi:hemoglobin